MGLVYLNQIMAISTSESGKMILQQDKEFSSPKMERGMKAK
jgi:hypothetical protein